MDRWIIDVWKDGWMIDVKMDDTWMDELWKGDRKMDR